MKLIRLINFSVLGVILSVMSNNVAIASIDAPFDLVKAAAGQHASTVTIPPGMYRVLPGIQLKDAHDLEIVADHVTFIVTKLSRAISFDHCRNVTLRGLTVDYDPLPFTQGQVERVAADFSWIDVKLDAGYPRQTYSRIDVCDPVTRTRKRGMPFLWGTKAAWSGDGIVRVSAKDIGKIALVSDPVSLSGGPDHDAPPHGITIDNCDGVELNHVTLNTAPGMGILEEDGEGNAKYINVNIVPGPKPDGATAERLLTTDWDAMQSKTIRHGPLVQGCEIVNAGDDSWSVQSSDYMVLKVEGRQLILGFRDQYCEGPQIGDHLCTSLNGLSAKVLDRTGISQHNAELPADVITKLASATPWSLWKLSAKMLKVTLETDSPFAVGASVYCPDRQGIGFVFRDNKIHSPGRGALVKAGDGLIEGNEFVNCHSAVTVCPEVPTGAAFGISGLTIRNNRIVGTGYFCPSWDSSQAGAISISSLDHPIQNITVDSNEFDDVNGVNIMLLGVSGVYVRNNRFLRSHLTEPTNTGGKYGVNQHSLIWADQCDGLTLADNSFAKPGPFMNTPVELGKKTQNIRGNTDGVILSGK